MPHFGKRVIVTREYSTLHAGAKAPHDIRNICHSLGFHEINLPPVPLKSLSKANLRRFSFGIAYLAQQSLSLSAEDCVIVQHPVVGRLEKKLLPSICRKAKSICIVHDLDVIRNPDNGVYDDLEVLRLFDVIICHNHKMKSFLESKIEGCKVLSIDIFDYLYSGNNNSVNYSDLPRSIFVIGNLNPMKAAYLYELKDLSLPLKVYGPNCSVDLLPSMVSWEGVLDMHKAALDRVDGFGLVWDGTSAEFLDGEWGKYLHFNTPHKLSMYLTLGIPVIVSKESAMAKFVSDEKVGIIVGSIAEACDKVLSTSKPEWEQFVENVNRIRDRIASGHYTRRAVSQALDLVCVSRLAAPLAVSNAHRSEETLNKP